MACTKFKLNFVNLFRKPFLYFNNSFLVSSADNLANSLNPDKTQQNVGPDLDQNYSIYWWYSWMNFSKKMILNKISSWQKAGKITKHAKS